MNAATGEPLGTAAEEAARLLASLESWFDAPSGGAGDEDAGEAAPADPSGTHGASCRACPLCRGVAYLRESHPDVLSHLTDAAAHLVAAVRSLTEPGPDQAPERAPSGSAEDAEAHGADTDEDRPRPSRAVRIDVQPDLGDRANSASSEQEPAP